MPHWWLVIQLPNSLSHPGPRQCYTTMYLYATLPCTYTLHYHVLYVALPCIIRYTTMYYMLHCHVLYFTLPCTMRSTPCTIRYTTMYYTLHYHVLYATLPCTYMVTLPCTKRLIHDILHIGSGISPRLPYQARPRTWRDDMGQGVIPGTIWKMSCHNLFIAYFTLTFSKHV
jgi:hypothetical protein